MAFAFDAQSGGRIYTGKILGFVSRGNKITALQALAAAGATPARPVCSAWRRLRWPL
jgi:hypothetical protein